MSKKIIFSLIFFMNILYNGYSQTHNFIEHSDFIGTWVSDHGFTIIISETEIKVIRRGSERQGYGTMNIERVETLYNTRPLNFDDVSYGIVLAGRITNSVSPFYFSARRNDDVHIYVLWLKEDGSAFHTGTVIYTKQ